MSAPEMELKRCGARKGKKCMCCKDYGAWRRGDPLADLPAAEVWVPTRDKS